MRIAWLLPLVAACGQRDEPTNIKPTPTPEHLTPPIDAGPAPVPLHASPHAAQITVVAITDAADAAFTADELGELRFWPSLDGRNEPIVEHGRTPASAAMARERGGHVVALLDAADGIEVLHLGPGGAFRGREVLPVEPGYEEIVAGTNALLARRKDQTLFRLDTNDPKGAHTLLPQPGEQVLAIAARKQTAIAGIADHDRPSEINVIRQIDLAKFEWGIAYEMPVPLSAPIAVSPSGHRVAGLHARTNAGVIVELLPKPHVVASDVVGTDPEEHALGFLDDDHVAFRGGIVVGVPAVVANADPWSGTRSMERIRLGRDSAVGDSVVVAGHGTHLLVAEPDRPPKFLGYRDLGVGFLRVTGSQVTLGFGNRILWIDDKLAMLHSATVLNDAAGGIAVDDHRLLKATYSYLEDDRSKLDVSIYDTATEKDFPLGSWSQGSQVSYDPQSHVFSVAGYASTVARVEIDPATAKATPLPALKTHGDATVENLDPAQADGVVAVAYSFSEAGMRVETFVDTKQKKPLSPATSFVLNDVLFPIGVDHTGTLWSLASRSAEEPKPLFAHRGGKEVKKLIVDGHFAGGSVDRAGTMLALYSNSDVVLMSTDGGKERWRVPVWGVNVARFSDDGKTLFVNTQGGLLSLDTASGARRGAGCGWGFGQFTEEPQLTVFMSPVVCAEEK